MKQLTKKQRREIYLFVLERIDSDCDTFMCPAIGCAIRYFFPAEDEDLLEEQLHEFHLFDPHDSFCWYDDDYEGKQNRLTVLSFCIAMTY